MVSILETLPKAEKRQKTGEMHPELTQFEVGACAGGGKFV
jgi:hypothetical protein